MATAPKVQLVISGTSIMTTVYASALEIAISSTARITKTYYSAGSTLIAMRVITSPLTPGTLYFMHSDHLGSSSLTTDASGNVVARQLYDAWGNVRYVNGSMPTDVGYTGQRQDTTGLTYLHARYYSNVSGRFISADTIVPKPTSPQQFNRYSYGLNNPIKYIDPSGHCSQEYDDWRCWDEWELAKTQLGFIPSGLGDWSWGQLHQLRGWLDRGISFVNQMINQVAHNWSASEIGTVVSTLETVQSKMNGGTGIDKLLGLKSAGGPGIEFQRGDGNFSNLSCHCSIELYNISSDAISHELGHMVDWNARSAGSKVPFSESTNWLNAAGWSLDSEDRWRISASGIDGASTYYAYAGAPNLTVANPNEDFSESFDWLITRGVGMSQDNPHNPSGVPSQQRRSALNVALGLP
jgi:RHS repeat-associated protein